MGETKVTRDLAELLEKILGKDKIDINFEHLPKDKKILRSLFETSSKRFTKKIGVAFFFFLSTAKMVGRNPIPSIKIKPIIPLNNVSNTTSIHPLY